MILACGTNASEGPLRHFYNYGNETLMPRVS